jgi:diguanylate cyclase (GGDEF)-like protein
MDLHQINSQSGSSPFAAQVKAGFSNLRFRGFLEKDFCEDFEKQSLLRGRIAAIILLVAVAAVTAIEAVVGGPTALDLGRILRFGIILPALAAIALATYVPALQRHYSTIAAVSVSVIGLVMIYRAQIGVANGNDYIAIGLMLVLVYVCLFPGLRFRVSTSIAASLTAAYFVLGYYMGMPAAQLSYSTGMLIAVVMVSALASYNLELVLRTSYLETRLLNELAERDGLTGLYNRRMFDDFIERVWRQSRREEKALEIVLVDIDYFKIYNDLYGHQAGDDCLKKVAATIAAAAKRPFDFAARYGGEEFVLVLYGPPREYAETIPEQIRRDISELRIPHEGSGIDSVVTVSVGVAIESPGAGRSLAGAIQIADEALYEAKRSGRNRLVCRDAHEYELETGNFKVAYGK